MNNFNQKTVLITGGNAGIGMMTAQQIARRGHKVIIACRTESKAFQAIDAIRKKVPHGDIEFMQLDLSSFQNTREFAAAFQEKYPELDVLINNAGVYPTRQSFTAEGFEQQIGVNYLGHFLLTHLLLSALERAGNARVVHLSSLMHNLGKINYTTFKGREKYSGTSAYAQSKLANAMFSNELVNRLPKGISSNALHPGGVDSDIYRDMPRFVYWLLRFFLISPERAGDYIADMAVSEKWQGITGEFKSAHGPLPISPRSKNKAAMRELYERSCELTGVEPILTAL